MGLGFRVSPLPIKGRGFINPGSILGSCHSKPAGSPGISACTSESAARNRPETEIG